jgi:large subunit ribosomal protein L30
MPKAIIAVRIRGQVNVDINRETTLRRLRLTRVNHAVLVDDRPEYLGMLRSVKDHTTWGEIDVDTLEKLLSKRGRVVDPDRKPKTKNPSFDDKYVAKFTKYNGMKALSEALVKTEVSILDVPKLKPIFRLTPPSGGFKYSVKRPYKSRGSLGYRAEEINTLILAMI